VRAPTPSAAAELLSPDGEKWRIHLSALEQRLFQAWQRGLRQAGQGLQWLQQRLVHPGRRLQQQAQRLDELEMRLGLSIRHRLRHQGNRLAVAHSRLERHNPLQTLRQQKQLLQGLEQRLKMATRQAMQARQQRLAAQVHALETVSPLATLSRGYAIVSRADESSVIRDSQQLKINDRVAIRLHRGRLRCRVEEIQSEENK
jgi:exodeoxyribonuclease VII large subunit